MFANRSAESPSPFTPQQGTVTIFSVWDGEWAALEEYDQNHNRVQGYVHGYHGLVKTLTDNIYYYQDELGSTSHVASSSGQLLESYKYDLYGKPAYFSPTSQPLNSSNYAVKDLFTGQRWINELALYDDRNRFMSPALGRFIQPDPIGFKGDASSLYRYCGNDWANRTDPMGTDSTEKTSANTMWQQTNRVTFNDHDRGEILNYAALNVQRINFRNAQEDMQGFTMGTASATNASAVGSPAQSPKSGVKVVGGEKNDRLNIRSAMKGVLSTPRGKDFVKKIQKEDLKPTIFLGDYHNDFEKGGNVYIDPHWPVNIRTTAGEIPATFTRIIAHEFGHAIMHDNDDGPNQMNNVIKNENPIMRSLHEPERIEY